MWLFADVDMVHVKINRQWGELFKYIGFDLHIIDKKGAENPVADNLSRLENVLDDPLPIDDSFPDEQ